MIQQQADIQLIRSKFQSALSSLHSMPDKDAIWVAFLNFQSALEQHDENLIGLSKKAAEGGAGKPFFMRLLQILRDKGQWALLVPMAKKLIRKWHHSSKVWLQYIRHMTEHAKIAQEEGQPIPLYTQPKHILERIRESVKPHKVDMLRAHLALSQFQVGLPEHGRSMFQEMVSHEPSRTDLWSIYIDAELKLDELERARVLCQRGLAALSSKKKKMQFFLKKLLRVEEMAGNVEQTEEIRARI